MTGDRLEARGESQRHKLGYAINADGTEFYAGTDDRETTLKMAVERWMCEFFAGCDEFVRPFEITVCLATEITFADDYLRSTTQTLGDDILEQIACNHLEEFCFDDPAFDWGMEQAKEFGAVVAEEVIRRFKTGGWRVDEFENVKVRILDIFGRYELVEKPAAVHDEQFRRTLERQFPGMQVMSHDGGPLVIKAVVDPETGTADCEVVRTNPQ